MLILFVYNIYVLWSQSMFDVVLNFSFLQTCGNMTVWIGVGVLCSGLCCHHTLRMIVLIDACSCLLPPQTWCFRFALFHNVNEDTSLAETKEEDKGCLAIKYVPCFSFLL